MPLSLAKYIDHSLLHPTLSDAQLQSGCQLANAYQVASVCIKPYAVKQACDWLADSEVAVGTVIGFPHGNSSTAIKVAETVQACQDGATEIDMVINIGRALGKDWAFVKTEIGEILAACRAHSAILKVIFENDFLPDDATKIKLTEICRELQVDYIKTSTGYGMVKGADGHYGYQGATDHDLKLMLQYAGPDVKVKAAGAIRTLDDAERVIALGVKRIGASATQTILDAAIHRYGGTRPNIEQDQTEGY